MSDNSNSGDILDNIYEYLDKTSDQEDQEEQEEQEQEDPYYQKTVIDESSEENSEESSEKEKKEETVEEKELKATQQQEKQEKRDNSILYMLRDQGVNVDEININENIDHSIKSIKKYPLSEKIKTNRINYFASLLNISN